MSHRRNELIEKMIALQANRKEGIFIHWDEHKLFYEMLADEGWYPDYDLAISNLMKLYIHQITNTDGIKVLDYYMVEYYKEELTDIVDSLKKNTPNRFPIIEKAFKAHKKGDYELSVPVLLSQIEGLFYDLTEKGIFSKENESRKVAVAKEWVNKIENENNVFPVILSVLEPLRENQNISATFKEAEDFPNALNRNKILHGRDISYASELNSYKAISLLSYIGRIVFDVVNKSETPSW